MAGPLRGQGERGSAHPPKVKSTPATSGPRSSMAHRPPTPPTRRRRQRANGANSHAPRLQPPNSPPLRSGGRPSWATAPSPEPEPRGRTQPRQAAPAPKPRLTSPSAFQQNTVTRNTPQARNISFTQPSRQPSAGGATGAFEFLTFVLCLSPFWITSTDKVSWPQGDQFLGWGMWHSCQGPPAP